MAVGIFAIFGCLVLYPCKVGGLDFSIQLISQHDGSLLSSNGSSTRACAACINTILPSILLSSRVVELTQ